jgi:ribonucleoside-diphosphate reductase alpha chain
MNISVITRSNNIKPWDSQKIKQTIKWAIEGTPVKDSIELEASLKLSVFNKITTREIQDHLITAALEKSDSLETCYWKDVAGKLKIWNLLKDVENIRGMTYGNYWQHIIHENQSPYFSAKEILVECYGNYVLQNIDSIIRPERDKLYDYAGANLLTQRYLLQGELPQEAFLTIALLLASKEKKSLTDRIRLVQKIYDAISLKKISLASPLLANLRTNRGSLTSCYILNLEDSLQSIYKELYNVALISKHGGGVGVCFSSIRASGSWVKGKYGQSGGVLPWVKLFNDTAIAVNQLGLRAGAVTVALDIWHLDILDFLEIQTESGDLRKKSYDVFPQIVIPDLFMERVKNNQPWTLFDPYEVFQVTGKRIETLWGEEFERHYSVCEKLAANNELKLFSIINSKKLYKHIMQNQIETGLPYLAFKDNINRKNPNQHDGYIPCVNLCTESFSNVKSGEYIHCCNLVSLNLSNLSLSEISEHTKLAVIILDNAIDITNPPLPEAKKHNDRYRTIGIGTLGLADHLAANYLKYSNPETISYIDNLYNIIAKSAVKQSILIAKDKGTYLAYDGSLWDKGELPFDYVLDNDWQDILKDLKKFGIRNSQLLAIAPNTTTSLLQNCTASFLPPYNLFFYDKSRNTVPICPPRVQEFMWFYEENRKLDQSVITNMTLHIQKLIDTGISMELVFDLTQPNITPKYIFDLHMDFWERGGKTISYSRSIQKDRMSETESCAACAN